MKATKRAGLAAAAVVVATLAPPPGPATAQTPELDAARQRVVDLQTRIEQGEATSQSLQVQLRNLSAQVGREQGNLSRLREEVAQTNRRIEEVTIQVDGLRSQIRDRARTVYKQGPMQLIDTVLAADSIAQFIRRIAFAVRIARHDGALVLQMRAKQAELEEIRAEQVRLEEEQASTVGALQGRQREVTNLLARQLGVLDDLARARAEALRLIEQLEAQLGDELGGLRRVAGRGMPITYGEWAGSFLGTLGAPASRANMVVMVAWQAAEGTQATWNPLATTMDAPGATRFNSHGVRNYLTKEQGIDASIRTLRLPNRGYEPILAALARGAPSMETAEAIRDSRWCAGCAGGTYVVGFIEAVEQNYDRYAG